jgi:hypothetical protein
MASSGRRETGVAVDGTPQFLVRVRQALAAPVVALRETGANRGLRAVQLSWAAVNLASWTAAVALTVAAFRLGGGPAVAVVVVVRTLPGALVGPAIAAVTASWPRLRVLAVSATAAAVASACSAAATRSLVFLVALGLVLTSVVMVFRAAQSAVLPELASGPRQLAAGNVLTGGIEALGVFAGPALAGLGLAAGGAPLAFALAACCAVAGALTLMLARGHRPRQTPARVDGSGAVPAARPRAALTRQPAVRLVLGLLLAQTVVSGGLTVLYPSLSDEVYGWGPDGVGALTAAFGLGGVMGSVLLFAMAGSSRLGVATAGALVLWAVPLLVLAGVTAPTAALVLLAVVGVGNAMFDMTTVTLLQRASPAALLTRAFVALEVVVVLGLSAGAAVAALLSAAVGPAAALPALGLPLLLVGLAGLPSLRRLDRTLAAPREQVALLRGLPAFALLPTPDVERLALQLRRVDLPSGATVVLQGKEASTYWLVDSGRLGVCVDGQPAAELAAGGSFGEIALLRSIRRTATVRTLTPCVLWALDRVPFLEAMQHSGVRGVMSDVANARLTRAAPAQLDHG